MLKKHKNVWFRKVRGSYLPSSWQGMVLYLWYVAYIVAVPVAWYAGDHSLWRLLSAVVPLLIGSAVLMQYIASKHAQ